MTRVPVGNSIHDANEVHNLVSNSDTHAIRNANEVRNLTSNSISNANSVANKSRVSDVSSRHVSNAFAYANVSGASTGSLYEALAGFSFFHQTPDDHALSAAMNYVVTNTEIGGVNALSPISGADANVQQHREAIQNVQQYNDVIQNVEPMVVTMDPEVDALNALLNVAANITRASLLGERTELQEYLTNQQRCGQVEFVEHVAPSRAWQNFTDRDETYASVTTI